MAGDSEPVPASKARLFDVRRIIGGLFVIYGVLVGAIGLFDSPAQINKAQGVNINLWAGLGMLILGALFLLWQWVRPAEVPSGGTNPETNPDEPLNG